MQISLDKACRSDNQIIVHLVPRRTILSLGNLGLGNIVHNKLKDNA